MAGGIVMISLSPVALLIALVNANQKSACERADAYFDFATGEYVNDTNCDSYDAHVIGFTVAGIGLLGGGIPMFIIGSKRVPADDTAAATLSPWVTPTGAGASLRLDL